jgi:hypothetical protein
VTSQDLGYRLVRMSLVLNSSRERSRNIQVSPVKDLLFFFPKNCVSRVSRWAFRPPTIQLKEYSIGEKAKWYTNLFRRNLVQVKECMHFG